MPPKSKKRELRGLETGVNYDGEEGEHDDELEEEEQPSDKKAKIIAKVEAAPILHREMIPMLGKSDDVHEWAEKVEMYCQDPTQRYRMGLLKLPQDMRYSVEHTMGDDKSWVRLVTYLKAVRSQGPSRPARDAFLQFVMNTVI